MPKYRYDIKQEDEDKIKTFVNSGVPIWVLSQKYNCSESLIRNIVNGNRKPPTKDAPSKIKQEDLCTYCGVNKKAPGNRFLCSCCYTLATCGEIV